MGASLRPQAQIDGFRDAIDVFGLIDLSYVGRPWTFEKKGDRGELYYGAA
jgi:hypothetical protein